MASFTVNFNANTNGDHYVGYRTYNDPINTYTVETINVVTPGLQSLEIQVPGNLYCGEIDYDGYIIAACQDQTDSNADGRPDAAITFNVTLNKVVDPCTYSTITCDNSPIVSFAIDAPGLNYVIGDPLVFTETIAGSELIVAEATVGAVNGSGGITSINMTNSGSYQAAPTVTVNSGTGAGASLTPAMSTCPTIDIRDYDCNGDNANPTDTPTYDLELQQLLTLCSDSSTLAGLSARFTSETIKPCHCEECKKYEVTNNGPGDLKVTAQTCWDLSHPSGSEIVTYTYIIPAGTTLDIGCMMKDTLIVEDPNLITVVTSNCS